MGEVLMYYDECKHHGAIICVLSHVFFSLIGYIFDAWMASEESTSIQGVRSCVRGCSNGIETWLCSFALYL